MKKIVLIVIGIVVLFVVYLMFPEAKKTYPPAAFDKNIEIAPIEDALTFARIDNGNGPEIIFVKRYDASGITGLNLTTLMDAKPTDPVDLFNDFGYQKVQDEIGSLPESALEEFALDILTLPLSLTDEHIAAGTNFAAHADESSVEDGPFLFPKLVTPTPFNASVSIEDGGLLDYEVELAYVTLGDTGVDEMPEYMGLILSNDFTNRAKLLRHLDPDNVISGDGFTTGKSAPGFLPVGNLFVIPKDYRSFSNALQLQLAADDELRQSASMELAIWDIDELFRQIAHRENTRWDYLGEYVGLPVKDGTIPARTLILAGTPDGTIFQGPTTRIMIKGGLRFLFGGWNESIIDNVIEHYITSARKRGDFLSKGDHVHIHVEHMGEIRSVVQ